MAELASDVANRKAYIDTYLKFMHGQVATTGTNGSVVNAMTRFSANFDDLGNKLEDTGISRDEIKTRIQRFYDREFLPTLKETADQHHQIN